MDIHFFYLNLAILIILVYICDMKNYRLYEVKNSNGIM